MARRDGLVWLGTHGVILVERGDLSAREMDMTKLSGLI